MIRGKVFEVEPLSLVVEVGGGVFLKVHVPVRRGIAVEPESEVVLYTHLYHRDEALELYGFFSKSERELFLKLIKVSSVGPKVALNILSRFSTKELKEIVEKGEYLELSRVPGIGPKRAKRLIVELRDAVLPETFHGEREHLLKEALSVLGYSRKDIEKAIQVLGDSLLDKSISDEDLVVRAIRAIGGA